ncbi:MAG: bifunctional [glutamine synthetase] adenylyltransferase/[glutamine synthetase]-adenylyl-L-tyrosine phosphorylase [Alphaproteobacteria bacterium]
MEQLHFLAMAASLPKAGDTARAWRGHERWQEATAADPVLAEFAGRLKADSAANALFDAIFGNSPHLTQIILREPGFFHRLVKDGPDATFDAAICQLRTEAAVTGGRLDADARLMAALRLAKSRVALVTGLADIAGVWTLETVTGRLSEFAGTALSLATAHLMTAAAAAGDIELSEPGDPERGSGYVILGLGKLGAHELNYSSDIDLIVLYDDDIIRYTGRQTPQQCFVRLTRDLVRLMEERTKDGYVFRTDLRLRPDPGYTPVALSMLAAETYYESMGQNWERAAMIKARPVAGDIQAGEGFLDRLRPFLWRKSLDFAAIQDIHSIKRQINAHRGGRNIAVAGHNVKLGRGGIREIEFFVQTQQLIWGGRAPSLRTAATCETLKALLATGHISEESLNQLTEAYRYLRQVEHRLQMIDDRQTHVLPVNDEDLGNVAAFLGYDSIKAFSRELLHHLGNVEKHYADLFEEAPELAARGNLVFTGIEDDPDTLETLRTLGFRESAKVLDLIRGWHRGRTRATRSARARELLTELMPSLLEAFSKTAQPDAALFNFDRFLKAMPTGVQLLSLFYANPSLLDLVAEIMGMAPRLAGYLSHNPSLFDAVLSAGFFEPLPGPDILDGELTEALEQARDYEDVLELARRWANDRKFRCGVQILRHSLDADGAGVALANIADTILRRFLAITTEQIAANHGEIKDGVMCVVALGKLGGLELTGNSDLDLLFVYDAPGGLEMSDGNTPLAVSQYYARLGQHLISAISAPTSEGRLFEVDMRLRPAGNAGPIVSSFEAFMQYQRESAWTWEHLALTRARVVSGPESLGRRLRDGIHDILTQRRDDAKLVEDVADMRRRVERGHPAQSIWEIKYLRGGLVDVEFIAQYLQLRHACDHPEILSGSTVEALTRIGEAGLLDAAEVAALIRANRLWRNLQGMLRLTYEGKFNEEVVPGGLKALLAEATDNASFKTLKEDMEATAAEIHAIYRCLIDDRAMPKDLT